MPLKPCAQPGCSRLVDLGQSHCPKHINQDKRERDRAVDEKRGSSEARKWYKRKAWQRRRLELFELNPLCVMCPEESKRAATIADHIIPHNGDHGLFWFGKLQGLCKPCHDIKKQRLESRARGGAKVQTPRIGDRRG